MKKKLLLGLGTIMLITLPLITFVSCGIRVESGKPDPEKPPVDPGKPDPEKPPVPEKTFVSGNLKITLKGKIIGFDNDSLNNGTLIIKENYNGVTITEIADWAFWNKNLSSVILSDSTSIIKIGDSAFFDNNLTSLTIPNSVTNIGKEAFGNNNLTSLIIPDSVTTIGTSAFSRSNLNKANLTIPSNFDNPEELKRLGLTVDYNSDNLKINASGTILGFVDPALNESGSLVIKENYNGIIIKKIGASAFYDKRITSLILPDSLTSIGTSSFSYNGLTSVEIPNSVTTIENDAFKANKITDGNNLTIPPKFDTPEELKRIGITLNYNSENLIITAQGVIRGFVDSSLHAGPLVIKESYNGITIKEIFPNAFVNNIITSLTLPDSLTTIGLSAFKNSKITSITFGNSLVSIGDAAFQGSHLTTLTLPDSITSIGISVFQSNQLTELIIPDSVTSIGRYAFARNHLTSVIIPDSVTTIGASAFQENKLISVTLGKSLTTIGENAFRENPLTSMVIPNSVTSIGTDAFLGNKITDRKDLTLPAKFDTLEELKRIGFNFTLSSKEVLLTHGGLGITFKNINKGGKYDK